MTKVAQILSLMRGWNLFIFKVIGKKSRIFFLQMWGEHAHGCYALHCLVIWRETKINLDLDDLPKCQKRLRGIFHDPFQLRSIHSINVASLWFEAYSFGLIFFLSETSIKGEVMRNRIETLSKQLHYDVIKHHGSGLVKDMFAEFTEIFQRYMSSYSFCTWIFVVFHKCQVSDCI